VVLVTSNHALDELAHDGAQSLALEPLDVPSGLLLLSARCGAEAVAAEPAAAGRLVELCDGLPLALHVAASRVSPRHGRTLAVVADELGDETRRLAGLSRGGERVSVSANFNLAYAGLPPEAARLYAVWDGSRAGCSTLGRQRWSRMSTAPPPAHCWRRSKPRVCW